MLSHAHQCPVCSHIYTCDGTGCAQELLRRDRRCSPEGYTDAESLDIEVAWHIKRVGNDKQDSTYNTR